MKTVLYTLVAATIVIVGLFLFGFAIMGEKTGYVEIPKIFQEFTYKKELEANIKKVEQSRKNILDSMEMELKVLSKALQSDSKDVQKAALFQVKREEFFKTRDRFRDECDKAITTCDEMIFKQINQYVKDFGAKHQYKYIYGAGGSGNLMYADTTNNITNEMIQFINDKYKGNNP